jgi:general secretion pathway protein H
MISRSDITSEAGFTLIELIVVLAILGLMTVFLTGNVRQVSPAVEGRAAAQAISGALRQARSEAIAGNGSVWFTVNLAGRSYQWGRSPPRALPGTLNLSLLTSQDQVASESAGRIRFDSDGGSSGGRISIAGGGVVWWVGIDWLSGRVSIEEKPRL